MSASQSDVGDGIVAHISGLRHLERCLRPS